MTSLKEQIKAVQMAQEGWVSSIDNRALIDAINSLRSLQLMTSGDFAKELEAFLVDQYGDDWGKDITPLVVSFLKGKGLPI